MDVDKLAGSCGCAVSNGRQSVARLSPGGFNGVHDHPAQVSRSPRTLLISIRIAAQEALDEIRLGDRATKAAESPVLKDRLCDLAAYTFELSRELELPIDELLREGRREGMEPVDHSFRASK